MSHTALQFLTESWKGPLNRHQLKILIPTALLCSAAVAMSARQLFVNADDDPTGYGPGIEFVCREASIEMEHGTGGWGPLVPCYVEIYERGSLVDTWPYECSVNCLPDFDGDHDIDLVDFQHFQVVFSGPLP